MMVIIKDTDGRDRVSEFDQIFGSLSASGRNDYNFIYTDYLSKSDCLNQMENASIFVSRSHGGYDSTGTYIRLYKEGTSSYLGSSDIYNGTALVDLSSMEVAIFAGCHTAANLETGKNLPDACVNAGATYAIGFDDIIYCNDANDWIRCFFNYYCVHHLTIEHSCYLASAAVYGIPGEYYYLAH